MITAMILTIPILCIMTRMNCLEIDHAILETLKPGGGNTILSFFVLSMTALKMKIWLYPGQITCSCGWLPIRLNLFSDIFLNKIIITGDR